MEDDIDAGEDLEEDGECERHKDFDGVREATAMAQRAGGEGGERPRNRWVELGTEKKPPLNSGGGGRRTGRSDDEEAGQIDGED